MISRRTFLSTAVAASALPRRGTASPPSGIHKAILISMLPEEMPYFDRFQLAVDVGFQLMEARTVETEKEAGKIKDAADNAGLRIHSVMNMAHWRHPLSSPDPAEVEASIRGMEMSLRQAKLYGADAVLLVPAVVRSDTTYEQARERSQAAIRKLLPLAEKLDVIIAIEEVWNKFLLTARDFVQYVDGFDHELIRGYFDVGNIVHYGVPQHWIRHLGKRIVKLHLKDYSRRKGFVNLGEGDVDWGEVRKALHEVGFQGEATVELRGGDRSYLADLSARVDRWIEKGHPLQS